MDAQAEIDAERRDLEALVTRRNDLAAALQRMEAEILGRSYHLQRLQAKVPQGPLAAEPVGESPLANLARQKRRR